MKLYYSPGACSISPHIALLEAKLRFELVRVNLREKTLASGGSYLAVNPKGYVPALVLDDGQLLTEGAVMVQYIADLKPELGLAPPQGTLERVRLQETLHFLATELHKGLSPLYNPKANVEFKDSLKERLVQRVGLLAEQLDGNQFLIGNTFTVADGYAFYCLRSWQSLTQSDLSAWPNLAKYYERVAARDSVVTAQKAEA
jgi:glutathione S-transferase